MKDIKLFLLAYCFIFSSCYDWNFKEEQVTGNIYLVLAEDFPGHYTLKYKESETNYHPLIDQKIAELYSSDNAVYIKTVSFGYYFINSDNPLEVSQLSEKEYQLQSAACTTCKKINVPEGD